MAVALAEDAGKANFFPVLFRTLGTWLLFLFSLVVSSCFVSCLVSMDEAAGDDCLPLELVELILLHCESVDIIRWRRVSRSWLALCCSPNLCQLMLRRDWPAYSNDSFVSPLLVTPRRTTTHHSPLVVSRTARSRQEPYVRLHDATRIFSTDFERGMLLQPFFGPYHGNLSSVVELASEALWVRMLLPNHHHQHYYSHLVREFLSCETLLDELLLVASKNSWCTLIRVLVRQHGRSPSYAQPNTCRTPLHVASFYNRLEAVNELLALGAQLETPEAAWRQTPLLVAVQRASLPVVQALVGAGANLRAADKDGWSVRTFLAYHRLSDEIASYLREQLAATQDDDDE